ncbi:hypothetical protein VB712_00215 [Spirulina sp. CCNP1310]|uniref:hypothetical protein n=1 Tax=Spirulina sp. CCNP1310 TaxID=3110249 RepID=UPI002B1FB1CF|nr:hypothetical protein [Spirulina sp. CCNP1310]MEA5417624.1 hypothetical protein [Spirulina sp. CCNP1310]
MIDLGGDQRFADFIPGFNELTGITVTLRFKAMAHRTQDSWLNEKTIHFEELTD